MKYLYVAIMVNNQQAILFAGSSTFILPKMNYFPHLHKDEISDVEMLSLKLELDEHTTKIKRTFAGLVFKLQKHIEDTCKYNDFSDILLLFDDEKFKKLLSDCSCVKEVFSKLHRYISFFRF